jgi:DNA-binding SARP family transcriptional activator
MLGLHRGSVVSADTLIELLWGDDPPRTADKALQTHISSLRRTLGDGIVVTEGAGWTLAGTEVDASRYTLAARMGRNAAAAGDTSQAVACFEEALTLWRGIPELPDGQRGVSEKTRWVEGHAALVEDRADALLATGRAAEIIGELEAAVADAPLRERRWGQLMLALYRAGRQGEALGAYQRARSLLAEEEDVGASRRVIQPPRRGRFPCPHYCGRPIGRPAKGPARLTRWTGAAKGGARTVRSAAQQLADGCGAHRHQGISPLAHPREVPGHR